MARKHDDSEVGERGGDLFRKIGLWLLVVAILAVLVHFAARGGNLASGPAPPTPLGPVVSAWEQTRDLCGDVPKNGRPVVLTLAYGPDIKTFIAAASERFARRCPHIEIKHQVMDELKAADAAAKGALASSLWIVGSELAVSLAAAARSGSTAPAQAAPVLFSSPYVFLAWEDRAELLQDLFRSPASSEGAWVQLSCPLLPRAADAHGPTGSQATAGSWADWYRASSPPPALPQPPGRRTKRAASVALPSAEAPLSLAEVQRWGPVKFRHTSPVRAALGLGTLYLVVHDYLHPPQTRTNEPASAADLSQTLMQQAPSLQAWLRRCRGDLGPLPETEARLIQELEEQGPARSDVIAVTEHAALALLSRRAAHGGAVRGLRILYPATSLRNEYRAVFTAPSSAEGQAAAEIGRKWIAFLLRDDLQRLAIESGLRPGNAGVAIRDHDVPTNPFLSLRRRGVELSLRQDAPPAIDAAAARTLMKIWEDAVLTN